LRHRAGGMLTWRTMSRHLLRVAPHILRASSKRPYELLVRKTSSRERAKEESERKAGLLHVRSGKTSGARVPVALALW
jgi:hypothetical protein